MEQQSDALPNSHSCPRRLQPKLYHGTCPTIPNLPDLICSRLKRAELPRLLPGPTDPRPPLSRRGRQTGRLEQPRLYQLAKSMTRDSASFGEKARGSGG